MPKAKMRLRLPPIIGFVPGTEPSGFMRRILPRRLPVRSCAFPGDGAVADDRIELAVGTERDAPAVVDTGSSWRVDRIVVSPTPVPLRSRMRTIWLRRFPLTLRVTKT